MFEKEAEEYLGNLDECRTKDLMRSAFKDGAEFGYKLANEEMDYLNKHWGSEEERKANEWHDLRKNPKDLPKEVDDYVTNIGILTYDFYGDGVYRWHTPFCERCDYSDIVGNDEVIAWREIPKFKESK